MSGAGQLIAVDIGNSSVHIGLGRMSRLEWTTTLRFSNSPSRTAEEWHSLLWPHLANWIDADASLHVCYCSVVPAQSHALNAYAQRFLGARPFELTVDADLGVSVETEQPRVTGTDRIANAVAAYAEYGGPAIIVDAGTATKVDAVTADGRFLGGAIAPGVGLSVDALSSATAQLFAVSLQVPPAVIGSNTTRALQSGIVLGHVSMIEGLVSRIGHELEGNHSVVVTGGYGTLLAPAIRGIVDLRPTLTLDGVRMALERSLTHTG
jgi:type III pantothenate kinase